MTIPIPYLPKEQAKPLQRVLASAANLTGLDEHTLLIALSGLSEATADEVSRGHSVRWPAFGMFAPRLVRRRRGFQMYPRCQPVFLPTRSFRQQVGAGAPPSDEGNKALVRYNKSHCRSVENDDGRRVFTAQAALRRQVEAQLGYAREA